MSVGPLAEPTRAIGQGDLARSSRQRYDTIMDTLKARVQSGRLVLDEPTEFPEGTVLDLTLADPGDDLDEEERAALHAALADAWAEAKAGRTRPASEVLEELRKQR